jgi:hypothetical protein
MGTGVFSAHTAYAKSSGMSLKRQALPECKRREGDKTGQPREYMSTNESVYPRWEREDRVSRFFVSPSLPIYQIAEITLIGGSMFVASALDKANLVGQFESERNAKEACKRDFADKETSRQQEAPDGV